MSAQPGPEHERLQDVLCKHASSRLDVKALDLFAAALEIDSVDNAPRHGAIAAKLQERWSQVSARDQGTLEEAKLVVVRRFGEAARTVVQRGRAKPDDSAKPAYRELYCIIRAEPSYPVRLAAAQEIGAGGQEAFNALAGVRGARDCSETPGGQAVVGPDESGKSENGLGPPLGESRLIETGDGRERNWREFVTRAWLAPLLVGSVTDQDRRARQNLERWLRFVQAEDPARGELRLSLEVALAQGFRYAANRRIRHPHARPAARGYLAEHAREMLTGTRFWFSQLTLLHALCLWSLPDGYSGQQPGRGRRADPKALVDQWIGLRNERGQHPFVVEAGKLAVLALETGQPERYIWIDESGIVARVGSAPASPQSQRKHNLWIPPSTGWTALHPRAQQLVADVLLLLNLAERGEPTDRVRRLEHTNRNDLPLCLAGDRSPLNPQRTVGVIGTPVPGSNCKQGCPFELCPYPPRGDINYRIELNEAFCRRQQALLRGGWIRRRAAPWQAALAVDLRRFWKQMAQRG
jgi:hypothetical protein